jgi:CrcB protein
MPNLLLVMLGGAVGAGFRYHIGRVALQQLGAVFPWGTWLVNLLGGLLMGVLAGAAVRNGTDYDPLLLFLGVGVLGGFTTFSAFSFETALMIERGDLLVAGAYAMSSVAGSIVMLFIGLWAARALA